MSAEPANPSPAARPPFWLWPHVLSLEAPAVAAVWLAALAHVSDLRLMPGVMSGLALTVWLIYLTDRLLDTVGVSMQALSVRHRFYRRFRWPLAILVLPAVAATIVWLGLWVIPVGLLGHSIVLILPIALYLVLYAVTGSRARRWLIQGGMLLLLLLVNMLPLPMGIRLAISLLITGVTIMTLSLRWHERVEQYFRKEAAAGLLFAFGCTTWTRFHIMGSDGPEIWAELILLGLLFVSNLTLISAHEDQPRQEGTPPPAAGTARGSIALCLLALAAIHTGWLPTTLQPLTCAVLIGVIGLEILWQNRQKLSEEAFRVWADVIVALPAVILLLIPASSPLLR